MSGSADRVAIDSFFAAIAAGDIAAMEALLHSDFVITESEALPYGGVYRGVAGWRDLLAKIGKTWTRLKPTVTVFVGESSPFAIMMDITLTSVATGKTLSTKVFELYSVQDGKIIDIKPFYWDTAAVIATVTP